MPTTSDAAAVAEVSEKNGKRRGAGILAHITSLPSPFGIGDIGGAASRFLNFLEQAGQSYWQFLPVGPTAPFFDNSPYMSCSAFAGSPLLISPESLREEGRISQTALDSHPSFSPYLTDYQAVSAWKNWLLAEAFAAFRPEAEAGFAEFLKESPWLDDYALFMALKEAFSGQGWFDWLRPLALRDDHALRQAREKYRRQADLYRFEQYIFAGQWRELRRKARRRGVGLIGDIPIYVGLDSADVWADQEIFTLRPGTLRPSHVAGVPPDYFSETGQRWGNPLYRWHSRDAAVRERLYAWWRRRIAINSQRADISRIDHFRAFAAYWSIPAAHDTAVHGSWIKGPGRDFFDEMGAGLGALHIIAEDLGIITDDVRLLRDELGFPGMKVLQFAFDGNPDHPFLPWNFASPDCVVYTGTHDNNTTLGWYLDPSLDDDARRRIRASVGRDLYDANGIHRDLIYLAYASIARLAMVPLQDVLGFGGDCRMNTPGVAVGNWCWRCAPEFLNQAVADYLAAMAAGFNRASQAIGTISGTASATEASQKTATVGDK
ncbi:MAG: 4-alpha-glucanotransferase [Desulfobulbaceae bacterium]|jgi:4-alpha-glucanotransferase|nr:4-alpha-glucanotransferase [Desulfobulbaceae bacterium]